MNELTPTTNYHDIIMRAATDPGFNIDKVLRMVEIHEAAIMREAEFGYRQAKNRVEGRIKNIIADKMNPQTRSPYASLEATLADIRPIYTDEGFSVEFTTEESQFPNKLLMVGYLSHGRYTTRHVLPVPISTTGARGGQMMSEIHATIGATTYGRRTLLNMMFNIGVEDDDGNRASGYPAQQEQKAQQERKPLKQQPLTPPPHDPETGEIYSPRKLERKEGQVWQEWAAEVMAGVRESKTEAEMDAWLEHNKEIIEQLKKEEEGVWTRMETATNKYRNKLKMEDKDE